MCASVRDVDNSFKNTMIKTCRKAIPGLRWFPEYRKIDAVADFISGVTIGLVIIPQSIAYVTLVGLSPKVGLLSSVIGGIFYTIFGTIKQISIGPTAMMSLLTLQYTQNLPSDSIGLLAFCCGITGFILSLINSGVIVEFISIPVSSAIGSYVALYVISAELQGIFGIQFSSYNFFSNILTLTQKIDKIRYSDTLLGVSSIILIFLLDKLKDIDLPRPLKKLLWLIAMSKNAITISIGCLLTCYFQRNDGNVPFLLTDPVTPGFPTFSSPIFDSEIQNTTLTVFDKVRDLGSGFIIIPIVVLLIHVSIAKSFGTTSVGVSHELFALSLCNICSSFFNVTPIAGAFTRSAVSNDCEARTPLANIYTMMMALFALTFLTPYFELIPRASLSAVIMTAVLICIAYDVVIPMWNSSRKDFCILFITFGISLYVGLQYGLIIGVLTNLVCVIYPWLRPTILIEKHKSEYGDFVMVTPKLGLLFPTIDYVHIVMRKTLMKNEFRDIQTIVINGSCFCAIDYTAIKGMIRIISDFNKQEKDVLFINLSEEIVKTCTSVDNNISKNIYTSNGYIDYVINESSTKTNFDSYRRNNRQVTSTLLAKEEKCLLDNNDNGTELQEIRNSLLTKKSVGSL